MMLMLTNIKELEKWDLFIMTIIPNQLIMDSQEILEEFSIHVELTQSKSNSMK